MILRILLLSFLKFEALKKLLNNLFWLLLTSIELTSLCKSSVVSKKKWKNFEKYIY